MFDIVGIVKESDLTYCTTSPRHPKARGVKGLYPLHIVVAENALGRVLVRGETVYHIDGFQFNNKLVNLGLANGAALMSVSDVRQAEEPPLAG